VVKTEDSQSRVLVFVVKKWKSMGLNKKYFKNRCLNEQDLLGQVSRLRKREGQKYVNFYGKSCRTKVILKNI
jgi:hypothetical protein